MALLPAGGTTEGKVKPERRQDAGGLDQRRPHRGRLSFCAMKYSRDFSREGRKAGKGEARGKWKNQKERIRNRPWVLFAKA